MEHRRLEGQVILLNFYPRKLKIEAGVTVTKIKKREIHCKKVHAFSMTAITGFMFRIYEFRFNRDD